MDLLTPKISCTTTTAPTGSFAGFATYALSSCPSSAFSLIQSPIVNLTSPGAFSVASIVWDALGSFQVRGSWFQTVAAGVTGIARGSLVSGGSGVATYFPQPAREAQKLAALGYEETPEIAGPEIFRVLAGECLQPPAQHWTSPRAQPVAACCRPEESSTCEHSTAIIGPLDGAVLPRSGGGGCD